jgi:hypothetical protein
MQGISVIMPSYLGEYPGSRKDPDKKFIRAVESFKDQTLAQKELIIVSDGCALTNQLYQERWQEDPEIRLIISEKMAVTWPGELREMGRSIAKYDWIRYLDTDDIILQNHLSVSLNHILKRDEGVTVLFDSHYIFPLPENPNRLMLAYVGMDIEQYIKAREASSTMMGHKMTATKSAGHNGTWQLIHHKQVPHRWKNSEHMGEDAYFIKDLKTTEKWQEVRVGLYLIAHNTFNRQDLWEI